MNRLSALALTGLFLALLQTSDANGNEVRWAITEWEDLTNADGTGLFNELTDAAFSVSGVKVTRIYVPWRRALLAVEQGDADFTGGLEKTDKFLESRHPINRILETVFFHEDTISNWSGLESLADKRGVWALGYLDEFPPAIRHQLHGEDVPRESALNMVLKGRADYYFDNRLQMRQTIEKAKASRQPGTFDNYRMEPLMEFPLYMVFTPNPRGERIKAIFDKGVEALYQSGKLQEIYRKWDIPMPPRNDRQDTGHP